MVKIAIVVYSTYGHILTLAKAEAEGVKAAGAAVDIFQLPSGEANDASAASDLPVITPSKLAEYDGVLFGIPSRFGTHPYAFKAFFDATGAQWAQGSYHGKYAGFFVTSGTQGGGQESVIRNSVTILAHHGLLYVPLGYALAFGELTDLNEVHGGSPWGAGSFAGPTGARQPSTLELNTARIQGKSFSETVARGVGSAAHGYGAAGAGAAGVGAAGAAGAGAAGASAAPTSGAAGAASGAAGSAAPTSDLPTTTGASNAASGLQNDASGLQSGAQDASKDVSSKAAEAKSAPQKGEAAAKGAEKEAEKESTGCCKCM